MNQETALVLDNDNTFDPFEAGQVVRDYVCGVCHGQLVEFWVPGDRRVLVVCYDHGNVAQCGRVMHSTVSIEMEYAYRHYWPAIRNLPDLWGSLIPPKRTVTKEMGTLGFYEMMDSTTRTKQADFQFNN